MIIKCFIKILTRARILKDNVNKRFEERVFFFIKMLSKVLQTNFLIEIGNIFDFFLGVILVLLKYSRDGDLLIWARKKNFLIEILDVFLILQVL